MKNALKLFALLAVFMFVANGSAQAQENKARFQPDPQVQSEMKDLQTKIKADREKMKAAREKLKPDAERLKANVEKMKVLREKNKAAREAWKAAHAPKTTVPVTKAESTIKAETPAPKP